MGKGTLTWNDSQKYEGTFYRNIIEGKGTYTFSNNDTHKGNFEKGKFSKLVEVNYYLSKCEPYSLRRVRWLRNNLLKFDKWNEFDSLEKEYKDIKKVLGK